MCATCNKHSQCGGYLSIGGTIKGLGLVCVGTISSTASVEATKAKEENKPTRVVLFAARGKISSAVSGDSIEAKEEINPARMVLSTARGKT